MNQIVFANNVFTVIRRLGSGSFGLVEEVRVNDHRYAFKIIKNPLIEGIKSLRELDIMSRLLHPNLMHSKAVLAEASAKNSKVGILMDLADRDLYKAMYDKHFHTKDRLDVLKQVTQGLHFLHKENYLHLDIKPLNILLFKSGREGGKRIIAKLSDFGLALRTEVGRNGEKYKNYNVKLITITHRSYNVLKGDRHYTIADDIWSLGMTIFEVLSGGYSLFSELKTSDLYNDENVLRIIERKLSPQNIHRTLSKYFSNLSSKIRDNAISLVTQMFDFNPLLRPNTYLVLTSKLFSDVSPRGTNIIPGISKTVKIHTPVTCDILTYEGFDILVRLCTRIPVKLETFFLAADIYQRSLAYREKITGDEDRDYVNTAYQACLSLYVAIKMIESFFADIDKLAELTGNLFSPNHLLKGENKLINLFEGKMYPENLFTQSTTFTRLEEGFNLSRNCRVYRHINLNGWKKLDLEEVKYYSKDATSQEHKVYQDKWGDFITFFKKTNYYTYLTDAKYLSDSELFYITKLYEDDSVNY